MSNKLSKKQAEELLNKFHIAQNVLVKLSELVPNPEDREAIFTILDELHTITMKNVKNTYHE
jgi:hypothetical protein